MTFNDAHLKFKGSFDIRNSTNDIILHHQGANAPQSVQEIHNYYLNRTDDNYLGIGYHYYVRKDGTVWLGRPENVVGGHAKNHNDDSIGICFEGNYEVQTDMPDVQFNSGVELIRDILTRYPKLNVKKHKDVNKTDCPGEHFPFAKMVAEAEETDSAKAEYIPWPTGLKATVTGTNVNLSWNTVSKAEGYHVMRHNGTKWEHVKYVTTTTFTESGLKTGVHQYQVTAQRTFGGKPYTSSPSKLIKVTISIKPVTLKVGSKVKITASDAVYGGNSKGVKIPSVYKNKTYTVLQVGTDKLNPCQVLIKELYSWVYAKDIKIVG